MKAWQLQSKGVDGLKLIELERPPLGHGQIRVRMRACSINFRDLLMVRGHYDPRMTLPMIPLSDGAGEVLEVAEGVTRFAVGDRVMGAFAPRWIAGEPKPENMRATRGYPLPGTLQTEVCEDAEGWVRIPEHLDYVQAATLPCAALTAWSTLVEYGHIHTGNTILVQGTGGVSLAALQIGVMHGARVIVTSSSDEKLERARELGAFATINYKAMPEWGKHAAQLADGRLDIVVEVGGAGTFEQSVRAVRPAGMIAVIGVLSGVETNVSLVRLLMSAIRVQGVLVGHRNGLERMARAFEAQKLEPIVDRVFGFEEAPAALKHLASGAHFGKVGIRID